ncbi:hypothetical protein [Nocardia sp. NPDC057668]|uniref:hypothetical protein n=1 Tax=Nocardia sp. NPDC057668 TaxID=3346202 RepID=UPI00366EE6C6
MTTLYVPARFNGPPDSGNGGYVAGLLAETRDEEIVTVVLRNPPPLETPLRVEGGDLFDGESLIARAAGGVFERAVPAPVSRATAAAVSWEPNDSELFGRCFVCGSLRTDGLRIESGPVGDGVVAAPWTPDGTVPIGPPLLWAAMDCPGAWTIPELLARPAVLGSMTATVLDHPAPGEPCVVVGALHAEEGRKVRTATALYGGDNRLLSRSEQVWIRLAAN